MAKARAKAKSKPAGKKKQTPAPRVAKRDAGAPSEPGWIDAGKGYALTLDGDKLVCRSPKGQRMASVPKEIKNGDVAEQLVALRDWLVQHARDCAETVDAWMLRSLPVPRATLEAVWDDPAWRAPLDNAIVVAIARGALDFDRAGFFRGVDPERGVGVVDLDGETAWLDVDEVAIPHPILIPDLDTWRELATELSITQGVSQLMRETHARPEDPGSATTIDDFSDGKFAMLMHAIGKARALGFRSRGGYAVCSVWEAGTVFEARYWIGADSPDSETYTGDLLWVDARERIVKLAEVAPVAYSEGVRMASAIYAARVVDKTEAAA